LKAALGTCGLKDLSFLQISREILHPLEDLGVQNDKVRVTTWGVEDDRRRNSSARQGGRYGELVFAEKDF
jgi:hypothetical protein